MLSPLAKAQRTTPQLQPVPASVKLGRCIMFYAVLCEDHMGPRLRTDSKERILGPRSTEAAGIRASNVPKHAEFLNKDTVKPCQTQRTLNNPGAEACPSPTLILQGSAPPGCGGHAAAGRLESRHAPDLAVVFAGRVLGFRCLQGAVLFRLLDGLRL